MMQRPANLKRHNAVMMHEAICGLVILSMTVLPLAWSVNFQQRNVRRSLERTVVMELIDGELELLDAGVGLDMVSGTYSPYQPHGMAATELPGTFVLEVTETEYSISYQHENRPVTVRQSAPKRLPEVQP